MSTIKELVKERRQASSRYTLVCYSKRCQKKVRYSVFWEHVKLLNKLHSKLVFLIENSIYTLLPDFEVQNQLSIPLYTAEYFSFKKKSDLIKMLLGVQKIGVNNYFQHYAIDKVNSQKECFGVVYVQWCQVSERLNHEVLSKYLVGGDNGVDGQ